MARKPITSMNQLTPSEQKVVEHLWNVRNMGNSHTVYVNHVSQSGLKRNMTFTTVIDDTVVDFTDLAGKLIGSTIQPKGMIVRGCGMDMTFASMINIYDKVMALLVPNIAKKTPSGEFEAVQRRNVELAFQ